MHLPECTIVIPTRNRAHELSETVGYFIRQELTDTPIVVIDDFSDNSQATADALRALTNCSFISLKNRKGQAGARNVGIRSCNTRYCLLLDDDCHIDNPDALVKFILSDLEEKTAIWRFETIREYDGYRDGIPEFFPRKAIGSFIGFGALLDREKVLAVGGFRDFLMYRWEEEDLSIRLYRKDLDVTYSPGIRFIHRHLPNHKRSPEFIQEYERLSTRNTILYYGLNFPLPFGPVEGIFRSSKAFFTAPQGVRSARLNGIFSGISELINQFNNRTPLPYSKARNWRYFRKNITNLMRAQIS